jgi:sugar phosphate isomerase/epimerase
MQKLALDFLTALELAPIDLVRQAAANDCTTVGIIVQDSPRFPFFPKSGLIGNTQARRDLRSACQDLGVGIDLVECFVLAEDADIDSFEPALESGAFLGASLANTLAIDRDRGRLGDMYSRFAEIASQYGLRVTTEVHRLTAHDSITTAVAFFDSLALDVTIELDALHFYRYGGNIDEILRHRDRIGRAQICDGAAQASEAEYRLEALFCRQIPGEGDFPLIDFLAALPGDIVVGVEVPRTQYLTSERIARCIGAARALVAQAAARNAG